MAAQAIPVLALAPVVTLWLGYGMPSKIVMVTLVTYFPVVSMLFACLIALPPACPTCRACRVPGGGAKPCCYACRTPCPACCRGHAR